MESISEMNGNINDGRYENCVIAYLDILGFKKEVEDSCNDNSILKNIIDSLKIVNTIPSGGKKVSGVQSSQRTIAFRSRFFSDSLVFFLKTKKRGYLTTVLRYQIHPRPVMAKRALPARKYYFRCYVLD